MRKASRAQDCMVTAAEGGITYWADQIAYLKIVPGVTLQGANADVDAFIANLDGLTFRDAEGDGRVYTIKAAQIERAIRRIVAEHDLTGAHIRRYIVSDDIDADAADCIIQIAAFGKLVYG